MTFSSISSGGVEKWTYIGPTPPQLTTSHTLNRLRVFTLVTLRPKCGKLDNSSSCLTPATELGISPGLCHAASLLAVILLTLKPWFTLAHPVCPSPAALPRATEFLWEGPSAMQCSSKENRWSAMEAPPDVACRRQTPELPGIGTNIVCLAFEVRSISRAND